MKFVVMVVAVSIFCNSNATKYPENNQPMRTRSQSRNAAASKKNMHPFSYDVVGLNGINYSIKVLSDGRYIKIIWPKRSDNSQT